MKTKIVTLLSCIISMTVCLTFCGCSLFDPPAPTEDLVLSVAKSWGIPFPEDFKIINYAQEAGLQDGEWLYILEYSGSDEKFIGYLSNEEESKVINEFRDCIEDLKEEEKFFKPYELPDLSDGYYWYYDAKDTLHKEGEETFMDKFFYLLYIPSANQILTYERKI